jgi:predicted anti-sigma-YlaC factor YlaD
MFSCRDATHLASARLDRPLTRRERLSLRFHLLICSACRLYTRQITTLSTLFQARAKSPELPTTDTLSPEAKAKIKTALNTEAHRP